MRTFRHKAKKFLGSSITRIINSSKAAVLIVYCCSHCLGGGGFCVWSLFCYAVPSVLSSFPIILMKKRELVALLKLFN